MQELDSSSWVYVTDPKAIAVLDDERFELLVPFFKRPTGVAEAARTAEVSLDQMAYLVERALELRLLRLERVEKRKGRAIKLYRTTGEVFFVPFKDIPTATLAEHIAAAEERTTPHLAAAAAKNLQRFADQGDAWGRAYLLNEDGPARTTASLRHGVTSWEGYLGYLLSDQAPPYMLVRQSLHLAPADAKALQRDLIQLLQRYEQRSEGGTRTYLIKLFLAED